MLRIEEQKDEKSLGHWWHGEMSEQALESLHSDFLFTIKFFVVQSDISQLFWFLAAQSTPN